VNGLVCFRVKVVCLAFWMFGDMFNCLICDYCVFILEIRAYSRPYAFLKIFPIREKVTGRGGQLVSPRCFSMFSQYGRV